MSVLKYFKNTPRSPPIGRQALSVIFFFKFATRSLEKRGAVARPNGRQGGPVAPPRATTGPRPRARKGGCRPPPQATGVAPLI